MKTASLVLNTLKLNVHLGWTEEERSAKQSVLLDVKIQFNEMPEACTSDQLCDTFCYDKLIQTIKQSIENHKFCLIEHLGHEIYQVIKKVLGTDSIISLRLNKKPEIPNLEGGVSFCYGDQEIAWSS